MAHGSRKKKILKTNMPLPSIRKTRKEELDYERKAKIDQEKDSKPIIVGANKKMRPKLYTGPSRLPEEIHCYLYPEPTGEKRGHHHAVGMDDDMSMMSGASGGTISRFRITQQTSCIKHTHAYHTHITHTSYTHIYHTHIHTHTHHTHIYITQTHSQIGR